MKFKKRIKILFALLTIVSGSAFSQSSSEPFDAFSIGLKLSPTLGYGLEAAAPLSEKFVLRGGLSLTAGINTPYVNIPIPDENIDDGAFISSVTGREYVPEFRAKLGANIAHGNLLVDFHPAGIFHLTAGVYIGGTNFQVEGQLVDWNDNSPAKLSDSHSWPEVDLGGQKLNLEGGRANIDLRLGENVVKPYFGLGVGRAIAQTKNRLSFKFELGAMYHGGYSLKQDGRVLDLAASKDEDISDVHDILNMVSIWPQMNFMLSYRIF